MEYLSEVRDGLTPGRVSRRGFLRLAAGALGVASAAVLVACGGRRTSGGLNAIIQITPDNTVYPASVSIVRGATVFWTNVSTDTHAITLKPANGQAMPTAPSVNNPPGTPQAIASDSGDIPEGGTWSYTFFVPGEYTFVDTKNQSLSGHVSVYP